MNLFKSKNSQALITSMNRARMYDSSRPSEVNNDGVAKGAIEDSLEKAGKGAGSRGGKVIGYTKSGKAIYETASHESHKNFSKQDHEDAADTHRSKMDESNKKNEGHKYHYHMGNRDTHKALAGKANSESSSDDKDADKKSDHHIDRVHHHIKEVQKEWGKGAEGDYSVVKHHMSRHDHHQRTAIKKIQAEDGVDEATARSKYNKIILAKQKS